MKEYDVIFEQNNLNNVPGSKVTYHEFNDLPSREISINKLARRDLSIITSAEYSQKQVTITMSACANTRAGTERIITTLKQMVQSPNGELLVLQDGLVIKYTATMNEFNIEWDATYATIRIVFIASDPFGKSVDTLSFANFVHNSPQTSATGVFQGSGTIEPTISMIVNSISGTGELRILNARTNQGITINKTLVSGDLISIDSQAKKVFVNNGLVDFEGLFPTWSAGTQQIVVIDSYASRNISVNVDYFATLA